MEKIKKYDDVNSIITPVKNVKLSKSFCNFLKKVLEKDPNKRIEIENISELNWIKENKNL